MFDLARRPGIVYPYIEKLSKRFGKRLAQVADRIAGHAPTIVQTTARVVCEPHGYLCEMTVNAIYDQYVVLEVPNGKGGCWYRHLTYEQVEYPPFSIAARAVAANDAEKLYFIDEKTSKSKREKLEVLKQEYIEEHWFDFYDQIVVRRNMFFERQRQYNGAIGHYRLKVYNTLDLMNNNNHIIWDFVQHLDTHDLKQTIGLEAREIMRNSKYWKLFENEIGDQFVRFLQKLGYDSASFSQWLMLGGLNYEVSDTIVFDSSYKQLSMK